MMTAADSLRVLQNPSIWDDETVAAAHESRRLRACFMPDEAPEPFALVEESEPDTIAATILEEVVTGAIWAVLAAGIVGSWIGVGKLAWWVLQ